MSLVILNAVNILIINNQILRKRGNDIYYFWWVGYREVSKAQGSITPTHPTNCI